jgi:2-methylisocitrate lyase-like PEP mutase family enzyme
MKNSATDFRKLHSNTIPLILPLAWDAASARLFENAGAKAIATSSAAVSWALGYPDGNKVPFEKVVTLAEGILRVATLPVSIDVEGGYSNDPSQAAQNVKRLVDLGVAGINLEDNKAPVELALRKLAAYVNYWAAQTFI